MSLAVDADVLSSVDLFGKSVTDLQEGIDISGRMISGTLKYVNGGWDAGTWSAEESKGNYLVLHADATDGATITVEVIGGDHGPQTLDEDGICICRIKNTSQKIRVSASKTNYTTNVKTYELDALVLGE